jgi:hypothetical protein
MRKKIGFSEVRERPGDFACIDLAKSWLKDCVDNHKICRSSQEKPSPLRVLDIGDECPVRNVRLLEYAEDCVPYVILSHCWDSIGKPLLKLFLNNKDQFLKSIPASLRAKTFVDAARIAKWLGFRCLWIDPLCVVQDCLEDVGLQLPLMGQIYKSNI